MVVFTIEYLLCVWSGGVKYEIGVKGNAWRRRKYYKFSPFGIVDFASTVPLYLQLILPGADLRMLRMFCLLRIFKLSRYNTAMEDIFQAIKAEKDLFSSALFLLLISCLLFSSLIYIVEGHDEHAVFSPIPAAMHWFMIMIISGGVTSILKPIWAFILSSSPRFWPSLLPPSLPVSWQPPIQRKCNDVNHLTSSNCAKCSKTGS